MPRLSICLDLDAVDEYFEHENIDLCEDCWETYVKGRLVKTIAQAASIKDLTLVEIALNDEDCGCEHPDYCGENYDCQICGKRLKEEDN